MRIWVNSPTKTDQRKGETIPLIPIQEEIVSIQEEIVVSIQEEIVSIQEEIVSIQEEIVLLIQEETLNLKIKNNQNQQLNSQQINNIVFGFNC